jgi:hypothetical protein
MTAPDGFWSTDDAAPGMGLSYWIEAICEAFLEMKGDGNRENFAAQLTKFQFGPIDPLRAARRRATAGIVHAGAGLRVTAP